LFLNSPSFVIIFFILRAQNSIFKNSILMAKSGNKKLIATDTTFCTINRFFINTQPLRVFKTMQNYFTIRPNLTITCLALLLGGCASDPVPVATPNPILSGEQMLRESQGLASVGDRWKKGKQLTERGNILVHEGQNKIDEGNRMIEEGEKIKRESEESYKNIKN
jgi:hypothetical protein